MFYRVFPYDPTAADSRAGGALFVPHSRSGRADNPDRYHVLYCSSTPEGAVAETFGRIPEWDASTFVRADGSRYALTQIEHVGRAHRPAYYSLDDAAHLLDESLRPSQVVTRERSVTQAWALRVFEKNAHDGVAWWSYYKPEWLSVALWSRARVRTRGTPEFLTRDSAPVRSAARELSRTIR